MSDRIVLTNMRFMGRHGYYGHELLAAQPFEVDVELVLDLQEAGVNDDLTRSVDYGRVYEVVRAIVESTSFRLLEAIAEAISHELLADFDVDEVGVRVCKPAGKLGGPLDHAGEEIRRRRRDQRDRVTALPVAFHLTSGARAETEARHDDRVPRRMRLPGLAVRKRQDVTDERRTALDALGDFLQTHNVGPHSPQDACELRRSSGGSHIDALALRGKHGVAIHVPSQDPNRRIR